MQNKKYTESGIIYSGNKYPILSQLLPLFPENINNFVDLFTGSLCVSLNIDAKYIYINDNNKELIEIIKYLKYKKIETTINKLNYYINTYNLNKKDKENYYKFRELYNKDKCPLKLYLLHAHSFSNIIRFNNQRKFNVPFGKREFNNKLRNKLIKFIKKLKNKNLIITNHSFLNFIVKNNTDFVYCDPPYLITKTTYNKKWNLQKEIALLEKLKSLDNRNIYFGLSNILNYNNNTHYILKEWAQINKYKIYEIKNTFKLNRKNKKIKEIYITNYKK